MGQARNCCHLRFSPVCTATSARPPCGCKWSLRPWRGSKLEARSTRHEARGTKPVGPKPQSAGRRAIACMCSAPHFAMKSSRPFSEAIFSANRLISQRARREDYRAHRGVRCLRDVHVRHHWARLGESLLEYRTHFDVSLNEHSGIVYTGFEPESNEILQVSMKNVNFDHF